MATKRPRRYSQSRQGLRGRTGAGGVVGYGRYGANIAGLAQLGGAGIPVGVPSAGGRPAGIIPLSQDIAAPPAPPTNPPPPEPIVSPPPPPPPVTTQPVTQPIVQTAVFDPKLSFGGADTGGGGGGGGTTDGGGTTTTQTATATPTASPTTTFQPAYFDPKLSFGGSTTLQSPDAIDRNAAVPAPTVGGGSFDESGTFTPTTDITASSLKGPGGKLAYPIMTDPNTGQIIDSSIAPADTSSGFVQSPDAADRNAYLSYDQGGIVNEPIIGRGMHSGRIIIIAGNGQPERVTPMRSSTPDPGATTRQMPMMPNTPARGGPR